RAWSRGSKQTRIIPGAWFRLLPRAAVRSGSSWQGWPLLSPLCCCWPFLTLITLSCSSPSYWSSSVFRYGFSGRYGGGFGRSGRTGQVHSIASSLWLRCFELAVITILPVRKAAFWKFVLIFRPGTPALACLAIAAGRRIGRADYPITARHAGFGYLSLSGCHLSDALSLSFLMLLKFSCALDSILLEDLFSLLHTLPDLALVSRIIVGLRTFHL